MLPGGKNLRAASRAGCCSRSQEHARTPRRMSTRFVHRAVSRRTPRSGLSLLLALARCCCCYCWNDGEKRTKHFRRIYPLAWILTILWAFWFRHERNYQPILLATVEATNAIAIQQRHARTVCTNMRQYEMRSVVKTIKQPAAAIHAGLILGLHSRKARLSVDHRLFLSIRASPDISLPRKLVIRVGICSVGFFFSADFAKFWQIVW